MRLVLIGLICLVAIVFFPVPQNEGQWSPPPTPTNAYELIERGQVIKHTIYMPVVRKD